MLSRGQEDAGARPNILMREIHDESFFEVLRFDAVGAAKTGGQPSERVKFSCSWLWWCQGPASTMSDHLRTVRAPLVPAPHPVQQQCKAQLVFRNTLPEQEELLLSSPLGHSPCGCDMFCQSQLTPQCLAKCIFYELMNSL